MPWSHQPRAGAPGRLTSPERPLPWRSWRVFNTSSRARIFRSCSNKTKGEQTGLGVPRAQEVG